ncbi:hypothetical protein [Plantactinospora sp. GCM10030261]|uniref:hypothetical protein n=1 Tax=Plantactinospora sp. GCM10030261 TaxID=3273420 RepID=UPI003616DE57
MVAIGRQQVLVLGDEPATTMYLTTERLLLRRTRKTGSARWPRSPPRAAHLLAGTDPMVTTRAHRGGLSGR